MESGSVLFVKARGKFSACQNRLDRLTFRVAYRYEKFQEKGGLIVCSTDVNSNAGKGMFSWIKSRFDTFINRVTKNTKVDRAVKEAISTYGIDINYSIGNLFHGKYTDRKTGKTFDEKSFSIDLRGVPFEMVKDIAENICKRFNQQSVLVVNHKNNQPGLIYPS